MNDRLLTLLVGFVVLGWAPTLRAQPYHVLGAQRVSTDQYNPSANDLRDTLVEYGDVDGDHADDMIIFYQATARVHVSRNDGSGHFGAPTEWHGWFAPIGEIPSVGDFNCDGLTDIVTFTMGNTNDVWVAFSQGTRFSASEKWHDSFGGERSYGGERPFVANFAGPGYCDGIGIINRSNELWISHSLIPIHVRSFGAFEVAGRSMRAVTSSVFAQTFPVVGDINADGTDDLVLLPSGSSPADLTVYTAHTGGWLGTFVVTPLLGPEFGLSDWYQYNYPTGNVRLQLTDMDGNGTGDLVLLRGSAYGYLPGSLGAGVYSFGNAVFSPVPLVGQNKPMFIQGDRDGVPDMVVRVQAGTVTCASALDDVLLYPGARTPDVSAVSVAAGAARFQSLVASAGSYDKFDLEARANVLSHACNQAADLSLSGGSVKAVNGFSVQLCNADPGARVAILPPTFGAAYYATDGALLARNSIRTVYTIPGGRCVSYGSGAINADSSARIRVVIDDSNVVAEGDEGNNELWVVHPRFRATLLRGVGSGRCLSVVGNGSGNGSRLEIRDCREDQSQRWILTEQGWLVHSGSGRCVDVVDYGTENGSDIQLYDCTDATNQQWRMDPSGALIGSGSGRCLDVVGYGAANGSRVQLYDCADTSNQKWYRAAAFRGLQSQLCLDTAGGATTDGTAVQIASCTGRTAQLWYQSQGQLIHAASGRCLDAVNYGTGNGTRLQLWRCSGSSNQQWAYTHDGALVGVGSGRCLDVIDYGTVPGSAVQLYDCLGGTNQVWYTR